MKEFFKPTLLKNIDECPEKPEAKPLENRDAILAPKVKQAESGEAKLPKPEINIGNLKIKSDQATFKPTDDSEIKLKYKMKGDLPQVGAFFKKRI